MHINIPSEQRISPDIIEIDIPDYFKISNEEIKIANYSSTASFNLIILIIVSCIFYLVAGGLNAINDSIDLI